LTVSVEACRRRVAGLVPALVAASIGMLLAIAWPAQSAAADARSDYLIRLLEGSTQFRVRAQAAISLGSVERAPQVVAALSAALGDAHPAVRAAAANSLGRLGDPKAIASLRKISEDPEPPVRLAVKAAIAKLEGAQRMAGEQRAEPAEPPPSGPPRYYVAVGKPGTRVAELAGPEMDRAHEALIERLRQIDGVVLAPANEAPAAARNVIRTRSLKGYYIDSSVTSLEVKPGGGVRAAVSVIVATYPDRAMRAMMQGTATAMGGGDTRAQAIAGAFRSALGQLPQAMSRD
jgi:hypothetical protein